jgi:hypothetical protein
MSKINYVSCRVLKKWSRVLVGNLIVLHCQQIAWQQYDTYIIMCLKALDLVLLTNPSISNYRLFWVIYIVFY